MEEMRPIDVVDINGMRWGGPRLDQEWADCFNDFMRTPLGTWSGIGLMFGPLCGACALLGGAVVAGAAAGCAF